MDERSKVEELINQFLERNKKRKTNIAVIGDVGVDQYFYVDANRVSPEFPIPVMRADNDDPKVVVPAMAGNVAAQFKNWNVDLSLHALVDSSTALALQQSGISTLSCVFPGHQAVGDDIRPFLCPRKRRFYQGQFPLCRFDIEEPNGGIDIDESRELLCRDFKLYKPEVAIFSDYNKGLFAKKRKDWFSEEGATISIVDPKKGPVDSWQGCTIFKPNSVEAEALSGAKDWKNQCNFFQRVVGCLAVVITQGGEGVVGKVGGAFFEYRPQKSHAAPSVIGAGDCFSAFLAMTMAHNFDIVDAVKIAYEAGAVYVQSRHNEPVSPYDLQKNIDPVAAKFVTPEFLKDRLKDNKLVFTNGCFDLIHEGHILSLKEAKKLGDKLVVALNTDSSIKRLKGEKRPIQSLEERMTIMAAMQYVDYVVSFNEDTPLEIIKTIKPEIVAKGGDYKPEDVVGYGLAEIVILPFLAGKSTTGKIEKLNDI